MSLTPEREAILRAAIDDANAKRGYEINGFWMCEVAEDFRDALDELRIATEDALAVLTTGAAPRCPMCEGPVKFEEYGDCTMHIFCADSEPHWAKTLEDGLLPAIAAGNRVALRARQGTQEAPP